MAEAPQHTPSHHSNKWYKNHPEVPRPPLAEKQTMPEHPLYGTPHTWIPIACRKFSQIVENGIVLSVLLIFAAVLVVFYTWTLIFLGFLLLVGVHKSGVISRELGTYQKVLWYCLAFAMIAALIYGFRQLLVNEVLPRADVHVDAVTIEIKTFSDIGLRSGDVGSNLPAAVSAHITGRNISTSTPTSPYPMVRASIEVRPFITSDHLEQEEELFTHGYWANEAYTGWPYVLNPSQPFSFHKGEYFSVLGTKWVSDTNNPFFATWDALRRGDVVLYVVTQAIYSDRWGKHPEVRTCRYFSGKDYFNRPRTCAGQFVIGRYQP